MVVDFDRHIGHVQQLLLRNSVQHDLSAPERFRKLCEEIATLDVSADYDYRNIFLFLFLNGDADFIDIIAEDQDFAHLIDTLPRLNQALVLRVILNANGLTFLQELIAFSPSAISISVIETIINSDELQPSQLMFKFVQSELANACFHKLILGDGEPETVLKKFSQYFSHFMAENFDWYVDNNSTSVSQAVRKALRFIHILQICAFCLKNSFSDRSNCWAGYLMSCPENRFDICSGQEMKSQAIEDIILACRNLLLLKSSNLLEDISVDDYLQWAEVKSECYQQTVARLAHNVCEILEKYTNVKLVQLPHFLKMLTCFVTTVAPLKVYKQEKTVSLKEIKSNLSNNKFKDAMWIKSFLKFNDVLEDEENIDIIRNNSELLDEDDVLCVFDNIISMVNNESISPGRKELLKSLLYETMKYLPLKIVVSIHNDFIEKCGVSEKLRCCDFDSRLSEAINKINMYPESNIEEWVSEFVRLSIMDSTSVIGKCLEVGLENPNMPKFIAQILYHLRPISEKLASEWIKERISRKFKENQIDIFPVLILELVERNVLSREKFLRGSILTALNQVADTIDWSLVSMWIKTLELVLLNAAPADDRCVSTAVLVLYLGQVIEYSQCSLKEFSLKRLQAREKTATLLRHMKATDISEQEREWLHSHKTKLSLVTQCHLVPFWSNPTENETFKLCFNSQVKTPEFAAYVLVEMIPFLSFLEWRELAAVLKSQFSEHEDSSYSVFRSFHQAVLLLVSACSDVDVNHKHISCLNYSMGRIGDILKIMVLPDLKACNYLGVLEETLQLLGTLPVEVWNRSGMDILPELIILMGKVPSNFESSRTLSALVLTCPVCEGRTFLENQMKVIFQGTIEEH